MWQVQGTARDASEFAPFEPERVLVEYDGPRSFTLSIAGRLFFAHWCDSDEDAERYLVVLPPAKAVTELIQGRLTFLDLLRRGKDDSYVVDVSHGDGNPVRAWRVKFGDVPQNVLPHPTARLSPGEVTG